jgi:hypothetical protein
MTPSIAVTAHGNQSRLTYVMPFLVAAVVYLVSSLPGLSTLYLAFSLTAYLYWTVKKKDDLALMVLLLGSSFSYTSLNIWNNAVVPGLPFLLLVLSLPLVEVRIAIATAIVTLSYIGVLYVFSVGNVFEVGISPVVVDLLVVASIPLAVLRFRKLSEHQFLIAFSACTLIALAKMILFAFGGIENPKLSTHTDATFLDTFDELTGFYFIFALLLIFTPNRLRLITVSLFMALVFHYIGSDEWIGYYGIGSQALLALVIFTVFLLVRIPYGYVLIIGALFLIIPMLSVSLIDTNDLKLQQLLSVLDILTGTNIALLPHSVHVRVAEIATFFDGFWWNQLFGGGLGGYINLSDHFPNYLGPDDYSEQQINSGKITTPHNLGYLMIKFGYVGMTLALLFLVLIYRSAQRSNVLKFSTYMTFGVFLILNLGYTLKISFLLGVLWVVIRNGYRHEIANAANKL